MSTREQNLHRVIVTKAETSSEDSPRYNLTARWLHGVIALIVMGLVIPAGVWIHYFEPEDQAFKMRLYNLHESLGLITFCLTLARLAWRWVYPPPVWPKATPAWVRLASGFSHASLYSLLILMPITGFLATNAWGFPLAVFEWIAIPSPLGKDELLARALSYTHWCGAVSMGVILCAHVLGAFYHRFLARDAIARRMI